MRIRHRKIVKGPRQVILPGVRDGDKNVDWRDVAAQLLEQNQELTRQLDELRESPWQGITWIVPPEHASPGQVIAIYKLKTETVTADSAEILKLGDFVIEEQ